MHIFLLIQIFGIMKMSTKEFVFLAIMLTKKSMTYFHCIPGENYHLLHLRDWTVGLESHITSSFLFAGTFKMTTDGYKLVTWPKKGKGIYLDSLHFLHNPSLTY